MDVIGIVGVAAAAVSIPLAAVAASTAVVGISQGVSSQQKGGGGGGEPEPDPKSDPRLAKFGLVAESTEREVHGARVVLLKGRLFLDTPVPSAPGRTAFPSAHGFSGFFLDYPVGAKPLGLVSTISRAPPELNWVFADADTLALRYGNKTASQEHIPGPWDWTADRGALTLEGWEGCVALREAPGVWGLYYDQEDDLLVGSGIAGERRVVQVSLRRVLE